MLWSMSLASAPERSMAAFDACTASSTGEKSLSFPPNVPNGVRTADRKTTPSPLLVRPLVFIACRRSGFLTAVDAELPEWIELGTAAGAVLGGEILAAVR